MNLPESNKKSVQFRDGSDDSDLDSDSNSIELTDSSKLNKDQQDYYDPIYFDTDSDSNQEDDNDASTFNSNHERGSSVGHITSELEKSTLGSIKEQKKMVSKKSKSRPMISDADLLYDPDQDDKD